MPKKVVKLSPVERSIQSRTRGIERMYREILDIKAEADKKVAAICKRIEQKKVLLDALKRGAIKP